MNYKNPLYSTSSNEYFQDDSMEYSLEHLPSFSQETYSGLGIYFPYPAYGQVPSTLSPFPISSVSTPSSTSSLCHTNDSVGEYLGCPEDTTRVDYFNIMLHSERDKSSLFYRMPQKTDNQKSFRGTKETGLQNNPCCDNLNKSYANVFKPEQALKEDCTVPNSPIPGVSIKSSPILAGSDKVNRLLSNLPNNSRSSTTGLKKVYPCRFCCRKFARRYDVRRHVRIHTGEKPYGCPCCSKPFSRSDALKRHIRKEPGCYVYSKRTHSK